MQSELVDGGATVVVAGDALRWPLAVDGKIKTAGYLPFSVNPYTANVGRTLSLVQQNVTFNNLLQSVNSFNGDR